MFSHMFVVRTNL